MFCVIYSFQVKEGQTDKFLRSWEELTKLIYQFEGSLGSRIHRAGERIYIAYAQWPDKKRWEESGDQLPPSADQWRKEMRESCEKIETIHELEMVSDLLKEKTFSK